MNHLIPLRRPTEEVGDTHEVLAEFCAGPFDLYGRHHEVTNAEADVSVTRLSEGLHLDVQIRAKVLTTWDRTLDLARYTESALPNEVPMQVFSPGTKLVQPEGEGDEVDPRWRGLDGLF